MKWYLFLWNFKAFKLLFTYIYQSLIKLFVLFKHKSFLLTWVCFCIAFQYFGWKIFTSCKNIRELEASLESACILVQNWHLWLESFWKSILGTRKIISNSTSLQFEVYQPLFNPYSHEKLLQLADPLQSLPYFLILIPGVWGRSVNFKIPKRFLCRRSVFPDYLSVSSGYAIFQPFYQS